MKYTVLLYLLATAASGLNAQSSNDDPHYVFLSGEISAQLKDQYYVVEEFDGRKLQLGGTKKELKPSAKLACSMKPVVAISNKYTEVSDLEWRFSSQQADMNALLAMNEMGAEQIRYEQGQDFEATDLGANFEASQNLTVPDSISSAAALSPDEIEFTAQDLDDLNDMEMVKRNMSVGMGGKHDTIQGRLTVVPRNSMENAFAAVVLSFEEANAQKRLQGIRRSVVRIVPIGNIREGVAKKLKFSCSFSERVIRHPKLDIFIFDGEGEPVATNISRAIKEITPEQLEKFRELEKIESLESAG